MTSSRSSCCCQRPTSTVLLLATIAVLASLVTSSSSDPSNSDDFPPPPFQHSAPDLLGGFNENDVTTPVRLHRNGLPIRHGRHFRSRKDPATADAAADRKRSGGRSRRRRRSTRDRHGSREAPQDETSDFQLANYTLQAFGETFNLHLTPYESFISPGYVLEFAGEPDDQLPRPEEKGSAKHCFYAGYVNGSPDETAIVSLCSGLFGAFRSNNSEYLIQPIEDDDDDDDVTNQTTSTTHETAAKRHRIYRRSTLTTPNGGSTTTPRPTTPVVEEEDATTATTETASEPRRMCGTRSDFVDDLTAMNVTTLTSEEATPTPTTDIDNDDTSRHHNSTATDTSRSRQRRHSDDDGSGSRKRRSKRYVVTEKTVEVMVTADALMTRFHDDVEVYVLTLMAIVNDIFLHPSIENLIKIVVVKLILVTNENHGPVLRTIGEEQLQTFSTWQRTKNYADDAHPEHFDVAIFLTRNDICSRVDGQLQRETLGIARIGSMCSWDSCGVIEDGGLNSAFTIAHELGHTLGARHDEQTDYCPNETKHMVMSASLDSNAFPWHWSKCSARLITRFLSNNQATCLEDRPTGRTYALPLEEPGLAYNLEAQCQMLYGRGSTSCSEDNVDANGQKWWQECGSLWCRDPRYPHSNNCRTNHGKWAEGTECLTDLPGWRWCQAGECVEKRKHYPQPGNWGEWGRFGRCSLTCGGGVKSADRECNKPPPAHGGDYCTGKRKKFRACNTQPCPVPGDLQLEQCTHFNNRSVHSKYTNRATDMIFVPDYPSDGNGKNLCKLNCRENTTDGIKLKIEPYALLKDGTPCHRDSNGICVDGICKRAGCDNVLGSNTKVDRCGVCGGDNSSCELMSGQYDVRPHTPGYINIYTFPAGATNIVIRQESSQNDESDKNYLVLKDWKGYYILNGNMNLNSPEPTHIVKRRSEHAYRGAVYDCDYSGSNSLTEIINCTNKIREELHLRVLVSGKLAPPMINWYYYMPSRPRYVWSSSWKRCSQACSGTQLYSLVCKTTSGEVVDSYYCSRLRRPSTRVRKCNTHCVYQWREAAESKCSSRCGEGTKSIRYQCRMVRVRGSDRNEPQAAPRFCTRPKPPTRVRCRGPCLSVAWSYSEWSVCSKTCGTGGRKTRTAVCRDSNGREWASSNCRSEPILERSCSLPTCYQWTAGDYTACMCSNPWISRRVHCTLDGVLKTPNYCDIRKKPTTRHNCHRTNSFCWKYSSWTQCSSTCGKGYQIRKPVCIRQIERTTVQPGYCSQSQRPANEQRQCYANPNCVIEEPAPVKGGIHTSGPIILERAPEGGWRTGEWTACSCSTGRRRRLVKCLHLDQNIDVSFDMCPSTKPHDSESCLPTNCDADRYWNVGDWGRCSQTCGIGAHRQRTVRCIGNAMEQATGRAPPRSISNNDCENLYGQMPAELEECTGLPNCPRVYVRRFEWKVGEWQQCSQSCGAGRRQRSVKCVTNTIDQSTGRTIPRQVDSLNCADNIPMPIETEDCVGLPVCQRYTRRYEWKVTDWAQCSETCGNSGYQFRQLWCSGGGNGNRCDNLRKPSVRRECNRTPCPEWVIEPWGECDRKCGGGHKSRVIRCQFPGTARDVDEKLCEILIKPKHTRRRCNRKPCKTGVVWKKDAWGECSTTCGRGVKTRRVTCAHVSNGTVLDNEACVKAGGKRPRHIARCIEQRRCPKWKAGPWSQCPEACGEHYQLRRVTCRYRRKLIVDARCSSSSRPQDLRMCQSTAEICNKFEWDTSDWQGCSETCGTGWSQRTARCMQVATGKRVNDSQCPSPSPVLNIPCSNGPCHAEWKIGPWAECSQTCGGGRQHRTIRCTYVNMTSYEEREVKSCRASTKPPVVRDCNRGECNRDCIWTTGDWNECSATCGNGVARRQVVCMDRRTQKILPYSHCRQLYRSLRPDEHKPCYGPPCKPTSCREMKRLYNTNQDGEYNLLIGRQTAKIYCKGMDQDTPFEYISLPRGESENYSEWFLFSNNNPDACPAGGARLLSCPSCQRSSEAGKTHFTKIRFLINHRRVQTDDFTFTNTEYGKQIAYGTAGDCFSRSDCPQGRFKINLTGTGFRVSNRTQWTKTGSGSTRKIDRSNRDQEVSGVCGGYCGLCSPEGTLGLILEHDPSYYDSS